MMHVGGYYDACGGYQEYIRGCSVHWGETMSTAGDIMGTSGDIQYIGGISWCMWGNIMMHVRDTKSTSGDVQYIGGYHESSGGYHEYIGDVQYIEGISWRMWGSKLIKSFQFLLKTPMYWTFPMYSWYPPDVLMISPWYTHGISLMYRTSPDVLMISPNVLNTPRCTHDSALMYSWCPPDVLNTHYRGWFWCRSCSKIGSSEGLLQLFLEREATKN